MAKVKVVFKDSAGDEQFVEGSKTALKDFMESLDTNGVEYKVVEKSDGSQKSAKRAGTEKE